MPNGASGEDGKPGSIVRVSEDIDLPPLETRRWVASRKAQIVAAVRGGRLSLEEACRRYNLSGEEYASWEHAIDMHGPAALRITRLRDFR